MTQLKQIQAQMIATGLIIDGFSSSRLIAFCAISDAGDLSFAEKILKYVPNLNVVAWNFAIRGYSESQNPLKCILLYKQLLENGGSRPDKYTYPLLFKACARLLLHFMGLEILGHALMLGLDSDIFVCNGIINMLVTCCELEAARKVFDEMCVRDLVSWNSLINGYVHRGQANEALKLYEEMKRQGVVPDEVTMLGLVSSTAQLEDLRRGREFHLYIRENGLCLTGPLCNALMDMYAKCGDIKAAKVLFDNMRRKTVVSWTTMVVGYAKHGSLDVARKLFDDIPEKDVVTCNAMIGAYVQAKCCKEALALFHEMQERNVKPDEVTMLNCLSACSQLGAIDIGVWIHRYVEIKKLHLNVALGTALIDMYAKCGNIKKALQVFEEMPRKNSLTWTAIIGGLALHGRASDALSHFSKMIDLRLTPDEVTFLGVLSACCHGGMVGEGRRYFAQMTAKYNLTPGLKHYSCMVDLLGRAGLLQEAEDFINRMPMQADAVVWSVLFFSCRLHGNLWIGEKAAWKLLELDPADSVGATMVKADSEGSNEASRGQASCRFYFDPWGLEINVQLELDTIN
ncbi:Pentatricopeptide repeat-containing protein At2g22410, mitochondrial [Dionaea muscipula]